MNLQVGCCCLLDAFFVWLWLVGVVCFLVCVFGWFLGFGCVFLGVWLWVVWIFVTFVYGVMLFCWVVGVGYVGFGWLWGVWRLMVLLWKWGVGVKTLLARTTNLYWSRGGGVVIAPASRSNKEGKSQKWQDSWWALCSQGFESLPRRHPRWSSWDLFVFWFVAFAGCGCVCRYLSG